MRATWKKYGIWINLAVFTGLILLLIFFVIMPLKNGIQASSDDIQKKLIDDSINRDRIAKIPEMEKSEASFAQNKDNLDVILDSNSEVDFIKAVEALADATGNKVALKIEDDTDPTTQPAADTKNAADIKSNLPYTKFLSFQINLEGDYPGALNFIHKLENMGDYVDVVSLDMEKSVQEQSDTTAIAVTNGGLFGGNGAATNSKPPTDTYTLKSSLEAVVYLQN